MTAILGNDLNVTTHSSQIDLAALHRFQQRMLPGYSEEVASGAPPEYSVGYKVAWMSAAFDRLRVQYRRLIAMTPQERIVMLSLWEGGAQTITDLARSTALSMSAISQLVDRLVERGQLERTEDQDDRRRKLVTVAPSAYVPLDPLMFQTCRSVTERFSAMPQEHVEIFLDGLATCHEVMTEVVDMFAAMDDDTLRATAARWTVELRELHEPSE